MESSASDGRTDSLPTREVRPTDLDELKLLHEDWFPVRYNRSFYEGVVEGKMMGTNKPLFTLLAVDPEATPRPRSVVSMPNATSSAAEPGKGGQEPIKSFDGPKAALEVHERTDLHDLCEAAEPRGGEATDIWTAPIVGAVIAQVREGPSAPSPSSPSDGGLEAKLCVRVELSPRPDPYRTALPPLLGP